MSEPIIRAESVVKTYTDGEAVIRVLEGADISIQAGETVAIVGKSGAGKSTLLHLLGLVDSPTEGRIMLQGRDVSVVAGAVRAEIRNQVFGFVFQAYHLVPELTAFENVILPAMMGSIWGWFGARSEARVRAMELLARVGLKDRASHRPSRLSGGERQRVAIARALINRPKIVFCGEPTGNLDEATGMSVIDLLGELKSEFGLTQVIVTHDRELASRADRVVWIEHGRVVEGVKQA